jgi:hypothetical protein
MCNFLHWIRAQRSLIDAMVRPSEQVVVAVPFHVQLSLEWR